MFIDFSIFQRMLRNSEIFNPKNDEVLLFPTDSQKIKINHPKLNFSY